MRNNFMGKALIEQVIGREILDSRGNPTVEAEVWLSNGSVGRGCAPSGDGTGKFEAVELRDGDEARYHGKGTLKAVSNINNTLNLVLKGLDPANTEQVDKALLNADGTDDKSKIGANAMLAVSIAAARAAANRYNMPLFKLLGGVNCGTLPVPMLNILNGGAHADNNLDIQEFMLLPRGAESFREGLRKCAEVYHSLAKILRDKGLSTAVGDEGGFAPDLPDERKALDLIIQAIEHAGYHAGTDFSIALDIAASEWKSEERGYFCPKKKTHKSADEIIADLKLLCSQYPITSLEDPLDEEDWDGWKKLTFSLGSTVQLVGDDLFATNPERLKKGISYGCGNAILVKLNQIGTLTETLSAINTAKENGYKTIISHRSGETEDTFIADLAVAVNAGQIKTGAPCRSERTAKYNRLIRIEEYIANQSCLT
ncbi:MAG: phosphopyruvate hydratase [Oscillospiraceae bacterium]|nr:phosphopyruvate hydratase [Oscillospiraceae bacterium]